MAQVSIKHGITWINNEEADGGGLWLPNIQRLFVWSEEQIERLFDSIMRQYPISTLLFWRSKELVKCRRFIDQFYPNVDLKTLYRPEDQRTKRMVLDGQQRLQSLYIGLKGSYEGKVLHFDVTSGVPRSPEDIRFVFDFKPPGQAWPWIPFRDIALAKGMPDEVADRVLNKAPSDLADEVRKRVRQNVMRAKYEFETESNLTFQEIDSTAEDSDFKYDDIVEIFIRANSGGTKLSKSDLLFSLLTAEWSDADLNMQDFLSDLNNGDQFAFDRDFVLKTCLVLLGKAARYEVEKFRDETTRKEIVERWDEITGAIRDVRDFLVSRTYVRDDAGLPSYMPLIPLVYWRFHYRKGWDTQPEVLSDYVVRTLLTGAFTGQPDTVIDRMVSRINDSGSFDLRALFEVVRESGRTLEITRETLLSAGYGSKTIHLLFNLWYPAANYQPIFSGNELQVDHIFPRSLLKKIRIPSPETGWLVQKFHAPVINQLANCMLLTRQENGPGGKGDMSPAAWFADKSPDYLAMHCIPNDRSLWEMDRYEDFVLARTKLIEQKFAYLLAKTEA